MQSKQIGLITIVSILAVICVAILIFNLRKNKIPAASVSPSPSALTMPSITVTPVEYADWSLFRNGYALPLPPAWKNTSDRAGTAVLEPGKPIGSIQKISVTVLSDAKAPQGQRFTTQKELDNWLAVSGEVQGPIQKIKNNTLDKESGVILFDNSKGENNWLTISWARKNNTNIYLTFVGNEKYGDLDQKAIDYIVSGFRFTPPPMGGNEEKK